LALTNWQGRQNAIRIEINGAIVTMIAPHIDSIPKMVSTYNQIDINIGTPIEGVIALPA
jgi:hypothetical protein